MKEDLEMSNPKSILTRSGWVTAGTRLNKPLS